MRSCFWLPFLYLMLLLVQKAQSATSPTEDRETASKKGKTTCPPGVPRTETQYAERKARSRELPLDDKERKTHGPLLSRYVLSHQLGRPLS